MTDLNAKIIPLSTETPGLAPTDQQCDVGEIAVNLSDGRIYSKRSDGTIVTLAGGSKIQDAEDFDLNKKPLTGFRYEYKSLNSSTPSAGIACYYSSYGSRALAFSTIDLDGEDRSADLYALEDGDTVRLLDAYGGLISGSTIDGPYNKNNNRITIKFVDGVDKPADGTIVQLDVYNGVAADQPLQYGDAIVWDDGSALYGDAFRPLPFKVESLKDVQLPEPEEIGSGVTTQNHWRWEIFTKTNNQCPNRSGVVGPGTDVGGSSVNASTIDMDGKSAGWAFNNLQNGATYYWRGAGGAWQEGTTQSQSNIAACSSPQAYLLGLPALKNWIASTGQVGDVVEVADRIPGEFAIVRRDWDVLQWSAADKKYMHQALLFDITAAQDFAYTQALPLTPRWNLGDWLESGEYTANATQWIFNLEDAVENDRQAFFERYASSTSIWHSADGTAWTETEITGLEVKTNTSTCEITFDAAPTGPAVVYIAFTEPGVLADEPIQIDQVMVWNGTHWRPETIKDSLALGLNDLTDVNTITNPPTDGQALVWDATNGYWKPGTVATDGGGAETLAELEDVSLDTPQTGDVLIYTGAAWGNAKISYTDLNDTPDIPQVIDDLGDVDTSTAPPTPGQVLTWDGSTWAPATATGGGGLRETVGGALTERADVTVTTDYSDGGAEDIEFTGLGEAGSFVEISATQACWVRFYGTEGARVGDALRPVDQDPRAGSGVLLEVRIQLPNEKIAVSPGAIYYNNDNLPEQTLYARVTNESGGAAAISVTVRAYTQTHTDAIVGGTFGSG